MANLRLALAQVNPTVGDLAGNALLVREWTARAAAQQAQLVAFTEMVLTGYPVEDLVFRESFVAASRQAVQRLAAELVTDGFGELAVIVGYLDADGPAKLGSDSTATIGPRNALAVLHRGRVAARYFKHHLPNYGVFDEDRYFVPGKSLTVLRAGLLDGSNVDIALTVCEDIWQAGGPFAVAAAAQVGLVVNINASPYELNKDDQRLPLVQRRAAEAGAIVAYVNTVGGQDELVFDGDSMIVAPDRTLLARGPQLAEALLVHDLTLPEATAEFYPSDLPMSIERVEIQTAWGEPTAPASAGIAARLEDEAEIWAALVLGLRDYIHKNGAKSALIAVSGGIDSAVVATIAADALGGANVVGISMPSGHSSQHSRDDAEALATNLGIDYRVEPIQHMVDAFLANLNLSGLAVENLQARVRGVILMAVSNQEGHLVLTTGNKSELAVGYSTLYGDSVGAYNPLKDVPKTLVWKLARWRNTVSPVIPESSITKPPSAELRPGQLDTDSLPEYDKLDLILADYIDADLGRDSLVAKGHEPALVDKVLRLVDGAEYKRRQSAPGTKISFKSFGRDRRLPITNRFREISG
ncbi:NAD+ synthase (glutamine-hydrolysing) [Rhizocola hellebori]|uniref:Glutamine-dependent NAD(+) synthetase n=1 Tax=Rhizocola hellebori TaxID=1392758 RepID=A0A8J3VG59_9ACTN|nr:NAD+ synthase [Rhizocola hellebori]GIH04513.1 NAD+ synthase (glutamine-hydrolysing) [Rhizocola hellebori]